MNTPNPTRRRMVRTCGVVLVLALVAAACGDDGVENSVSDAAQAAENAAENPTEANVETAESAAAKASAAIDKRYNAIVEKYDQADAKIQDSSRQAYAGFRNDLAAIEADLVQAADSTGSNQADAWHSAKDKAEDLSDAVSKHERGADQAADEAFDKLVDDLSELETEIERGLGIN